VVMTDDRWAAVARATMRGQQRCRIDFEAVGGMVRDILARLCRRDGTRRTEQQSANLLRRRCRRPCKDPIEDAA